MKGMTAHYLLRRTYKVEPGDTIVVHAAAGGMGLILCQWAKSKRTGDLIQDDGGQEVARPQSCPALLPWYV